jgi:hypothetical protein
MNFQPVKEDNSLVESCFLSFCLGSKPYDFCSLPTASLRRLHIKNYYNYLLTEKQCFFLQENGTVRFFIAVEKRPDDIYVDFIFGEPFKLSSDFKRFRSFYNELCGGSFEFFTVIHRKHKLKNFLNCLKNREHCTIFSLDNGEIHVKWLHNGLQK